MLPADQAALKKAQIEAEFKRYKMISELRARKAKEREQLEAAAKALTGEEEQKPAEPEIKLAAKARRKFQRIDARGQCKLPLPKDQAKERSPSRWAVKTDGPAPEVVNRTQVAEEESGSEESEEEEGEGEGEGEKRLDVRQRAVRLAQRIEAETQNKGTPKKEKRKPKKECEEEFLRVRAKELREHFEKVNALLASEDVDSEKRQHLEEELRQFKLQKEQLDREQLEQGHNAPAKEPICVAANHASKMTNKWEKILQKKEKEAQRSKTRPKKEAVSSKWDRPKPAAEGEQRTNPSNGRESIGSEGPKAVGQAVEEEEGDDEDEWEYEYVDEEEEEEEEEEEKPAPKMAPPPPPKPKRPSP